jgi:hypothetical protein
MRLTIASLGDEAVSATQQMTAKAVAVRILLLTFNLWSRNLTKSGLRREAKRHAALAAAAVFKSGVALACHRSPKLPRFETISGETDGLQFALNLALAKKKRGQAKGWPSFSQTNVTGA